jgi:hypothetical protein
MSVLVAPMSSRNVASCTDLWADRATYSQAALNTVIRTAGQLLTETRALGSIVLEDSRPRAFGLSTFLDETFVEKYLADPYPQLGRHLLATPSHSAPECILDVHGIGERNSTAGNQLVVLSTNFDLTAKDPDGVLGALMHAFQETHRGYRIARIIVEVLGEPAIEALVSSGSFTLHHRFSTLAPNVKIPSCIATLTRTEAGARRTPLLPMFLYNPPTLGLTYAEQQLLRTALSGCTDLTLSETLNVSIAAVKARWMRIQERVGRRVPELLGSVGQRRKASGRGAQIRHLILDYVRRHPSELTPYVATRRHASPNVAARARAASREYRGRGVKENP